MNMTPTVSVVIDTYNYGHFVEKAIDSVLSQTLPEVEREIIVVDDGSTDDTPERVAKYGRKINYVRKVNGGQGSAFNTGVSIAKGEIISFLDADDYYYPSKLKEVLNKYHSDSKVGAIYNRFDVVDEAGTILFKTVPKRLFSGNIEDRILLGFVSGCPSSGISVRRSVISHITVPEMPFRVSADHFYLNILPLMTYIGVIETPLHAYRVHSRNRYLGETRSGRISIHSKQNEAIWDYAREVLGKEFYRSLYEMKQACEINTKLQIYTTGIKKLLNTRASLDLKIWSFIKLSARMVMSDCIFLYLRRFRDNLVLSRLRF